MGPALHSMGSFPGNSILKLILKIVPSLAVPTKTIKGMEQRRCVLSILVEEEAGADIKQAAYHTIHLPSKYCLNKLQLLFHTLTPFFKLGGYPLLIPRSWLINPTIIQSVQSIVSRGIAINPP